MDSVKTLKNGKAFGHDNVSAELMKNAKDIRLFSILLCMFNDTVIHGLSLSEFNVSLITPIPKQKNASRDPSDYRPISVSSTFCTVYEKLLYAKTSHLFTFNNIQFGYKRVTSCKHASFVVKETINYYKRGGSPCYAASLDISKAFDKMWRNGLFYKMIGKIEDCYWRAIVLYYRSSIGYVKVGKKLSSAFVISEGVKQGGIISSYLFNYFLDGLLNDCISLGIGARIGRLNVCIVAYCDDITLLSPVVSQINTLLNVCNEYSQNCRLDFNIKKCNWL